MNRRWKKWLILILFVAAIVLVNRDIFEFNELHLINRSFDAEHDEKGDYPLPLSVVLPKGEYQIQFSGQLAGRGNGYIFYCGDEIVLKDEFSDNELDEIIPLSVSTRGCPLRISASYSPNSEIFLIDTVLIRSNRVFLRDSILRHLTKSFLIAFLFGLLLVRFCFFDRLPKAIQSCWQPEREKTFMILLLLAFITAIPYYQNNSYTLGNDLPYHLSRIEGIKVGLQSGYFPVRIHLFLLQNYGYGNGLYYPDIFLYFPALLRLLGFEILTSYKIFMVVINFLTIFTMYWAAKEIGRSRLAGFIAAFLYAFASYRLSAFYFRAAVGELQAMIFLPLIILGFFRLFRGQPRRWQMLAAGFTGLALSHIISLMIAGIFSLIFVLFSAKKMIRDRRIVRSILTAFFCVIGVYAFFFLPMGEQLLTGNTKADFLVSAPANIAEDTFVLPFHSLISLVIDWDHFGQNLGLPLLLIPLLLLLLPRIDSSPQKKAAVGLLIVGVLVSLMATELFPWQQVEWMLKRIQTSFRLLEFSTIFLILGGSILSAELIKGRNEKRFLAVLAVFCLVCASPIFAEAIRDRQTYLTKFNLNSIYIGKGEYLPLGADSEFIDKNRDTVLSENAEFETISFKRRGLSFTFEYRLLNESGTPTQFEIPLLYYKGYQAEFVGTDGEITPMEVFRSARGLTAVTLPKNADGRITVSYKTTLIQSVGNWISGLTIILLAVVLIRKKISEGRRTAAVIP